MPQRILRQAGSLRLMARYHVKLLDEKAFESVSIQSGCSGHMRMMPSRSDKHSPRRLRQPAIRDI